jgi:hypothetical protein
LQAQLLIDVRFGNFDPGHYSQKVWVKKMQADSAAYRNLNFQYIGFSTWLV